MPFSFLHLFYLLAYWLARCNFVFNHQRIHPPRIIEAISHSATTFKDATSSPSSPIMPCPQAEFSPSVWSPPAVGFVKINVDGGGLAGDGLGFLGVVARDADGSFLAACR